MKKPAVRDCAYSGVSWDHMWSRTQNRAQDSYPKFFLNDAGDMSGLEIDSMRALEQHVPDLRFVGRETSDITFVPWKRLH